MEFSTRAEGDMDQDQLERLIHLRRANWNIVTAIKHMKELQKNVDRYMCAENPDIRQEYNTIRLNLAILLRALFISAEEESPTQRIEQIRAFRERMEDEDIIANGTLDRLIREQRITPDMATSLMNDSAFSYDIQNNLINAAEIVFANLYSTEKDMELTEADTDLEQAGDEPPETDTGTSG
jgi:phosphate:Na+ symporter